MHAKDAYYQYNLAHRNQYQSIAQVSICPPRRPKAKVKEAGNTEYEINCIHDASNDHQV